MIQTVLRYKYYFLSFLFIGFLVYFPKLFNGFVWDDVTIIFQNDKVHHFNFSMFYDSIFNTGYIYRQILVIYLTFMYTVFGSNPIPYHYIQILLHIFCTSLIFLFFTKYFNKSLSFFLALLFLIHPINSETVLWVSSTQTIIYTIFGITALVLLQNKRQTIYTLLAIGLLLFLSLLTYEIGIMYILIVVLYLFFYKPHFYKQLLAFLAGFLLLYVVLRLSARAADFSSYQDILFLNPTLIEKIYTSPAIILYYFKMLLYPLQLYIWQYWVVTSFSFEKVVLPFAIINVGIFLQFWLVKKTKKTNRKMLILFIIWLFVGMISLLQFIPLHMTVADRWFYFPFIGLLGIIGYIAQYYWKFLIKYKIAIIISLIILFSLYAYRTYTRVFDWKDNVTLFTHDLQYQPDHPYLIRNLAYIYSLRKDYKSAIPYLEKMANDPESEQAALYNLGVNYEKVGDCTKALEYFESLQKKTDFFNEKRNEVYLSFSRCYLQKREYEKVISLLSDSIVQPSPQINELLFIRAKAYIGISDYMNAKKDLEYLRRFANTQEAEELYKTIVNK